MAPLHRYKSVPHRRFRRLFHDESRARAHTPVQGACFADYERGEIDLVAIGKNLSCAVEMILARQYRAAFVIWFIRENFQFIANGTWNRVPDEEWFTACGMAFRVLEYGTWS